MKDVVKPLFVILSILFLPAGALTSSWQQPFTLNARSNLRRGGAFLISILQKRKLRFREVWLFPQANLPQLVNYSEAVYSGIPRNEG